MNIVIVMMIIIIIFVAVLIIIIVVIVMIISVILVWDRYNQPTLHSMTFGSKACAKKMMLKKKNKAKGGGKKDFFELEGHGTLADVARGETTIYPREAIERLTFRAPFFNCDALLFLSSSSLLRIRRMLCSYAEIKVRRGRGRNVKMRGKIVVEVGQSWV